MLPEPSKKQIVCGWMENMICWCLMYPCRMAPDLNFAKRCGKFPKSPSFFLTAADEEMNIIMGLDIGGDDYITKPFKLGVLVSRVNALLRRAKDFSSADTQLESNGMKVLLLQGQAFKNGKLLDLTAAEYKLLCLFMRKPEHGTYQRTDFRCRGDIKPLV